MNQSPVKVQNLDFPTWTHSGNQGPIHYQIVLQPSRTAPGSPWLVHVRINTPYEWILKKATLGDKSLVFPMQPMTQENASFEMEYSGDLPPFGPGPQVETQWDTPTGPLTLRLDHGLQLPSTTLDPPILPVGGSFPWAASLVLGLILLVGCGLWWIRKRPKNRLKKWRNQARATQPPRDAPWPVWETWLGKMGHSAQKLIISPTTNALISQLDKSRFGVPYNDFWQEVIQNLDCKEPLS